MSSSVKRKETIKESTELSLKYRTLDFTSLKTSERNRPPRRRRGARFDPYKVLWTAPASPFGLLEEDLYQNPWKLLVGCLFLNKTKGSQVYHLCVAHGAMVSKEKVYAGLGNKRAQYIKTFSGEYLYKEWRDPKELTGLGHYASDAYFIFCKGAWKETNPEDKELKRYVNWMKKRNNDP